MDYRQPGSLMNRVRKGQIKSGQFADFIALSDDYFRVPEAGN